MSGCWAGVCKYARMRFVTRRSGCWPAYGEHSGRSDGWMERPGEPMRPTGSDKSDRRSALAHTGCIAVDQLASAVPGLGHPFGHPITPTPPPPCCRHRGTRDSRNHPVLLPGHEVLSFAAVHRRHSQQVRSQEDEATSGPLWSGVSVGCGARPARRRASRSRNSMCAFRLRRSSLAQRCTASSTAGSIRSRNDLRSATTRYW